MSDPSFPMMRSNGPPPLYPSISSESVVHPETSPPKTEMPVLKDIQAISKPSSPPRSLKDRVHQPQLNKTRLSKEISQKVEQARQTTKEFEQLYQDAHRTRTTQTISQLVQYTVSDIVLKGGAVAAQSGIPFLMNTSAETMHDLIPATEGIRVATDVIDLGTGMACLLHKYELIDAASKELKHLKSREPSLEPEQLARLEKLEKIIKYERSLLNSQATEQGIRTIKNFFSYVTFVLSMAKDNPLTQALVSGANALISGVNAALYGLFFYRAHQNLKAHRGGQKTSRRG